MKMVDAAGKPKGMCIATRCTSVDQFVEMFHRFVDEDSFFVSTNNTRPPGLETSFSVQLADGTPVLRGLCVVLQAWTNAQSPFKTPGVRLGIKRLTASSMTVFERLLVTRSASPPTTIPPPLRKLDATPTQVRETKTQPVPRVETRTPGSDLVLPANPLMNLTDESLEGYVDCTLYEETANYFPAADDGQSVDPLVPPPKPSVAQEETPALFAPRPVARSAVPVEHVADDPLVTVPPPPPRDEPSDNFAEPSVIIEAAADLRDTTSDAIDESLPAVPLPLAPPAAPLPRKASLPPIVVIPTAGAGPATAPTLSTPPPMPPRVTAATPPIPTPSVAAAAPPIPTPRVAAAPPIPTPSVAMPPPRDTLPAGEIARSAATARPSGPPRRRRFAMIAGAGVLAAATILSITAAMGADDEPQPARTAANTTRHVIEATPAAGATPAVVAPAPEAHVVEPEHVDEPPIPNEPEDAADNPDPDGDGGAPAAGDGPCRIAVASTPAGSIVYLDGVEVAPSPITIATTCGKHKVDIKHPRYRLLTKLVTPSETAPANVEVMLQRPTHTVSFVTQPAGATVFIDGKRAGTTPTVIKILGFSNLKVEIKKLGFATLSTRLYSKVSQDKFSARLTKW